MPLESVAALLRRWGPEIVIVVHLATLTLLGRIGPLQLALDAAFLGAACLGPTGRRTAHLLFPVWLMSIYYVDVLPPLVTLRGEIHVVDLYEAELRWFGVSTSAGLVPPCELFRTRHWAAVDLVCGVIYLAFQPLAALFAALLFFRSRPLFQRFVYDYLIVHILGFVIQIAYPAAPPWYVEKYGLGPVNLAAASDPAGLIRFDQLTGLNVAQSMYAQSSNVFGAMPSLHIALALLYPLIGFSLSRTWGFVGATVTALTAFGAIYFRHHYVLDLLAGAAFAVTVDWAVGRFLRPRHVTATGPVAE